ncbi:MAG: ATP-binding cassette domain-containing protein [Bradymonadia bacterium]
MTDLMINLNGLTKVFETGFLGSVPVLGSVTAGLQVKGIAQRVEAVTQLSLSVQPGEIYGFLGPNGAGKTTTLKMLMGLVRPTSGHAEIMGRALGDRAVRAKVGYLPEHPYFYEHLKPTEFLCFYGRLYGASGRDLKRRAEALVEKVGLGYAKDRTLRKFSKGMVQRLGLAQTLINDPELVILDEPMSGLDPMGRKTVRDLIFELKDQGKTVFFSSHILQDVEMVCDRVGILNRGQLIREGRLSDMLMSESSTMEFECGRLSAALQQLTEQFGGTVREHGQQTLIRVDGQEKAQELLASLIAEGQTVNRMTPIKRTLEEIFVEESNMGGQS